MMAAMGTKKKKIRIEVLVISLIMLGGLSIVADFDVNSAAYAKTADVTMVPASFSQLAEIAGPAVVNIRTVKTIKGGGPVFRNFRRGPHGGDDPFKDFFEKFFGEDTQREFKQPSLGSGFIIDKEGFVVTSLNIIDKDETFKEMDVDVNFVYTRLNNGHKLTTSQPSPVEFNDIFEELIKQGAEKIFVLTLAPPLSGTFQSATLAKNMLDKPEIVHVFESKMAAFGNEMITLELIEMIKENKEYDEIVKRVNHLIDKSHLIFTVEGLENLRRSGRLSRAKAIIGTVLRVKPLIQMVEGKLDLFKSARTHKKVFDAILENMSETTKNAKTLYIRVLSHNSLETARALEAAIKEKFSNIKITFNEYLGPVFSLHLGANGYGVSWTTE